MYMQGEDSVKPIRVCVVVENHPAVLMGGAQYQAHLLAQALSEKEDVAVTYLARKAPCEADASALPYRVEQIGRSRGSSGRGVLFFDSYALWKQLETLQPHVIYQRMKQSYTEVCALYAREFGIPLVFHCAHDLDVSTRWLWRFRARHVPLDMVESIIGSWGLINAQQRIVQTERQAALLRQHFGLEGISDDRKLPAASHGASAKSRRRSRESSLGRQLQRGKAASFVRTYCGALRGTIRRRIPDGGRPGQHRAWRSLRSQINATENLESVLVRFPLNRSTI